jgi:hypothetical protein
MPCVRVHSLSVLSGVSHFARLVTDMIRGDINQAKVNKCLIALINRKVVQKTSNVVSLLSWIDIWGMLTTSCIRAGLPTDGTVFHHEILPFVCSMCIDSASLPQNDDDNILGKASPLCSL